MATRNSQDLTLVAAGGLGNVQDSQEVILVAVGAGASAILSQELTLVAVSNYTLRKLRPLHAITAWRKKQFLKKHWGGFQNAALLAAAPFHAAATVPRMMMAQAVYSYARAGRPHIGRALGQRRRGPLGWVIS